MGTYQSSSVIWDCYLIYLRKSRQDDPNETVEEVLSKHENILQEYALREFGGRIPEENIYREVVSGESIDDREEIKKVLARIEDPRIQGVLVIEPSRLSRGDLIDCGKLINDFRYTRTLVATPYMTYDLENKMERKFFQDELLRGRDYLEYTKEILRRGREAAIKRGCYIGTKPPYGFNKIKIGKDHTLEPNENADIVRMIFNWYANEGIGVNVIAKKLNQMNIPSPDGKKWKREVLNRTIRNPHYIGKVVYNHRPKKTIIENGEIKRTRQEVPYDECIVVEGKHDPIIDMEIWKKAQEIIQNKPKVHSNKELTNPLAGIFRCSKCGYMMERRPGRNDTRYYCGNRHKKKCFKSVKDNLMIDAVYIALKEGELPKLQEKVKNGDGDARKIQQRLIAKLEKQMSEYRDQEDLQYELLETRKYTQELFDRRNAVLRSKMEDCEKQLYLARASLPKSVDYAERLTKLETAIEALKNDKMSINDVNGCLKQIVEKIEFTGTPSQGRYGPRNGEKIHLDVTLRL